MPVLSMEEWLVQPEHMHDAVLAIDPFSPAWFRLERD